MYRSRMFKLRAARAADNVGCAPPQPSSSRNPRVFSRVFLVSVRHPREYPQPTLSATDGGIRSVEVAPVYAAFSGAAKDERLLERSRALARASASAKSASAPSIRGA